MTARMRTRNRQPLGPLPLTEKAAWVFLPTVPVELVSKTPITYGSSGSTYSADEEGRALDTTASAGGNLYAEIAHSTQIQIPPGSAVFVMRVKMAANLGARISKTTANGATDNEFDFIAYEYLGAGVLTVALTRVGGGGSRAWGVLESAYRPPSNKWVTLAVYAPSVVDYPSVFFADGVRLTATDLGGSGSGAPDTSTQPIRFNKRDDLSTSNDQSKIAIAYAIPGGNEAMAERLSRNPWQLFAPQRTARIYSFPTAGGGATVAVPAGALTLTGYAPTVAATAHQTIAVPAGALTLTGFAPTVSTSAAQTIAVPAASLTLTGFAPTVAATANQSISVPAGSLTLTGYAPTVYTTAVTTIAVPAGTLTLTGYAPTVSYTTHAYIGVPAGALTLTGYAPTVIGGTSSIWTPASASSGTWTPASASGGTWTPQ